MDDDSSDSSPNASPLNAAVLNAAVGAVHFVTEDLFFLQVVPDSGVRDFIPGQSLALGLPANAPRAPHLPPDPEADNNAANNTAKIIKRAYSIGSSPDEKRFYEFYIALVHQGALTPRFLCLEAGSRLFAATKPVGTFTLQSVPDGKEIVFVSTGTGIAPFISMLRTASNFTRFKSFVLLHGVRHSKDLGYDAELQKLQQSHGNFHYMPVVSRDPDFQGLRGHVTTALFSDLFTADRFTPTERPVSEARQLDPERHHVFLCGNPSMIADVTTRMSELGYRTHSKKDPTASLHVESYW